MELECIMFKGATKLYTKVIFVSATKHNQHFKTAVFHNKFVKSNQISTYRKLNLPLTSSISFDFLLTSRGAKKIRTDQSIPHVFLLCLKSNYPQTFKSGICKNPFLQCVRYWYNLLRWMFFIQCDNWKTFLFVKVYRYSETFEAPCCCFLWSQCFERSPYFMRYLHNNNMMLVPKQSSNNFRN